MSRGCLVVCITPRTCRPILLELVGSWKRQDTQLCWQCKGLAIFFGGCVIAWQTTVQPSITQPTAQSKLVSYCHSLNAGQAAEAMLATMMGVPSGRVPSNVFFMGTTWRRLVWLMGQAVLRGEPATWKSERPTSKRLWKVVLLVASGVFYIFKVLNWWRGLTKPLLGQAFETFLADLGMASWGLVLSGTLTSWNFVELRGTSGCAGGIQPVQKKCFSSKNIFRA